MGWIRGIDHRLFLPTREGNSCFQAYEAPLSFKHLLQGPPKGELTIRYLRVHSAIKCMMHSEHTFQTFSNI